MINKCIFFLEVLLQNKNYKKTIDVKTSSLYYAQYVQIYLDQIEYNKRQKLINYNRLRAFGPNDEDFIFLVGCTDIGAVGGGDSELFSGFPNSYNKKNIKNTNQQQNQHPCMQTDVNRTYLSILENYLQLVETNNMLRIRRRNKTLVR